MQSSPWGQGKWAPIKPFGTGREGRRVIITISPPPPPPPLSSSSKKRRSAIVPPFDFDFLKRYFRFPQSTSFERCRDKVLPNRAALFSFLALYLSSPPVFMKRAPATSKWIECYSSPNHRKAQKRIFGIFQGFLDLYTPPKTPQMGHFVRFCGVFWAAQNHAIHGAANGAAKSKSAQKRCFCGAYNSKKWKTDKNPFAMSLGSYTVPKVSVRKLGQH